MTDDAAPPPLRQEWTLRLLGLASVAALAVIGYICTYQRPESPEIVTAVVSALTTLLGAISGAKAALSTQSPPKIQ
jgi:uncharacterized membrane protein (DUF4010 family)